MVHFGPQGRTGCVRSNTNGYFPVNYMLSIMKAKWLSTVSESNDHVLVWNPKIMPKGIITAQPLDLLKGQNTIENNITNLTHWTRFDVTVKYLLQNKLELGFSMFEIQ